MTAGLLPLLLALLAWTGPAVASDKEAPQWIVVTAPAFRAALTPLCDQRRADGLKVVVVQTTDVLTAKQIGDGDAGLLKEHLHKLCRPAKGPTYVLLVGAVKASDRALAEKTVVPPLAGTVGRMQGQPSDSGYACPDKEQVSRVAVGRFPARTEEEARHMVQKTLAFERDRSPAPWRNRVTLLIGNPGGGSAIEKQFAESLVQSVVGSRFERVHPSWTGRAVIHAPQSPFCVPDDTVHDVTLRYLQEGQMFALYLGHSSASGLWSQGPRFLDRADWAKLKMQQGAGIFFSCGCFGCQLQGADGEGYGLTAMRNPGGPVAVIGAHGESYAAMGQLAIDGLLDCLSPAEAPARLADYWLAVRAGLARGKMDGLTFWLYDQADGSRGKVPLAVQRREHLEMWMLLGDPAMRLPIPTPICNRPRFVRPVANRPHVLLGGLKSAPSNDGKRPTGGSLISVIRRGRGCFNKGGRESGSENGDALRDYKSSKELGRKGPIPFWPTGPGVVSTGERRRTGYLTRQGAAS